LEQRVNTTAARRMTSYGY